MTRRSNPAKALSLETVDEGAWADFWDFVPRGSVDCWEWAGPMNVRLGRPIYARAGKMHYAYRVAWVLTNGAIPDGLGVLHHCDNPPCCRPDHLFLGTTADNSNDMWAKGRGVKVVSRYGMEHHNVRLADEVVRAARERYANGGITILALSKEIGVRTGIMHSWLGGATRRAAGGPIDKHQAALAQAAKLRAAERRRTRTPITETKGAAA